VFEVLTVELGRFSLAFGALTYAFGALGSALASIERRLRSKSLRTPRFLPRSWGLLLRARGSELRPIGPFFSSVKAMDSEVEPRCLKLACLSPALGTVCFSVEPLSFDIGAFSSDIEALPLGIGAFCSTHAAPSSKFGAWGFAFDALSLAHCDRGNERQRRCLTTRGRQEEDGAAGQETQRHGQRPAGLAVPALDGALNFCCREEKGRGTV